MKLWEGVLAMLFLLALVIWLIRLSDTARKRYPLSSRSALSDRDKTVSASLVDSRRGSCADQS